MRQMRLELPCVRCAPTIARANCRTRSAIFIFFSLHSRRCASSTLWQPNSFFYNFCAWKRRVRPFEKWSNRWISLQKINSNRFIQSFSWHRLHSHPWTMEFCANRSNKFDNSGWKSCEQFYTCLPVHDCGRVCLGYVHKLFTRFLTSSTFAHRNGINWTNKMYFLHFCLFFSLFISRTHHDHSHK